jgi:hypothetical protein
MEQAGVLDSFVAEVEKTKKELAWITQLGN